MNAIEKILQKHTSEREYSFKEDFIKIIVEHCEGYNGTPKEKLKSFFGDMQHGGCVSGMIGCFIYHSDNKEFYIKHIDDLEYYKEDLEENIGDAIENKNKLPHYTFMVWLCFEEFCYNLYTSIFEQ